MNFFFVINNKLIDNTNNEVSILKIPVTAKVKSEIYSNFTEKISNYVSEFRENYLNEILNKSDDDVKQLYQTKVNLINIYFKYQLTDIKLNLSETDLSYDKIDVKMFDKIIKNIDIFFIESEYKNCKNIDDFKVILTPNKFTEIIQQTIEKANTVHIGIEKNYDNIINLDRELLLEKNKTLATRNLFSFRDIIEIIKKREKINYIILDLDVEITNSLIELNNIRFFKLKNKEIMETLSSLKEIYTVTNNLEIQYNNYIKIIKTNY